MTDIGDALRRPQEQILQCAERNHKGILTLAELDDRLGRALADITQDAPHPGGYANARMDWERNVLAEMKKWAETSLAQWPTAAFVLQRHLLSWQAELATRLDWRAHHESLHQSLLQLPSERAKSEIRQLYIIAAGHSPLGEYDQDLEKVAVSAAIDREFYDLQAQMPTYFVEQDFGWGMLKHHPTGSLGWSLLSAAANGDEHATASVAEIRRRHPTVDAWLNAEARDMKRRHKDPRDRKPSVDPAAIQEVLTNTAPD